MCSEFFILFEIPSTPFSLRPPLFLFTGGVYSQNSKLNPLEKLSCTGTPASKDLPRSILQRRAGLTCAPTSQQLRGKLELDGLIRSMIASTFDRVRRDTRRFKIVTE